MNARRVMSGRPAAVVLSAMLLLLAAGPAAAISSRTLLSPTGVANDELGSAVGSAGDVNGDGYADVIVGAQFYLASGTGRAYVYFGGPIADAVADLALIGEVAGDHFGNSVGTAGDVNGDGYDDVIVGAYNNGAGGALAGRAYVYFGGPAPDATADLVFTGAAAADYFGFSVGTAGDVNGDGYDDMVVGAIYSDVGGTDAGRAYVYYGGPGADVTPDITLTGAAAGDWFGFSVGAGDVNGDGYPDVIVGAPGNDANGSDAGRVYVYFSGPGADATADLTLTGGSGGDSFGFSVGTGDVNGDGDAELIISARDYEVSNMGRAYVYYGGPGADAGADLTFTGAAGGDALGSSVGTAGDVNGDGYSDVIIGANGNDAGGSDAGRAYIYFGGPGADAVADITLTGAAAGDGYGYAVGTAGDVDGDGYSDVIVGAYLNDAGGTEAGRAYVISIYPYQLLSPNGGETWIAGQQASVRWRGHDPADIALSLDGGLSWRTLLAGVGGLADNAILVPVPSTPTDGARVRVTYTGQTAIRPNSDASDALFRIVAATSPPAAANRLQRAFTGAAAGDNLGGSVAPAGDVNGDGYDDVIVGAQGNDAGGSNAGRAYVYYGGPAGDATADWTLTGAAATDIFGFTVSGAGDVNGDGFADVIVGAHNNDAGGTDAGRAYIYYGGLSPDATADLVLTGAAASDAFGISVSGAGDVNGDGFADVIVGARFNDAGGAEAGRAYVYYGGPTPDNNPDLVFTGAAASDFFGQSVSGAGDVNGDGFSDVVVGAYTNDAGGADAGRVYLYYGGPSADATADLVLTGAAAGDFFGRSVSAAGDVNGDGFSDLVVGAFGNDVAGSLAGRAYVYYGGPIIDAIADLVLTGAAASDFFGFCVSRAGDVNADGYADVVVGAYSNDAGGADAGRAYLYLGGVSPDGTADLVLTGAATGDFLGLSVSGAGDVNRDGFADLIVSAYQNDAGGADAGRAYLYDFNRYFVTTPNGGETWNVGAVRNITWLGAEPADLWLSADGGVSYALLESGVGGAESNLVQVRVPHTPTRFARLRVAPHDASVSGRDHGDSLFTIQASVSLLSLTTKPGSAGGVTLEWSTDPGVGPEGLVGYRLYRLQASGSSMRIGPELIAEPRYHDAAGDAGTSYRLAAVNGLQEEVELGRITAGAPIADLTAWPTPVARGARLTIALAPAAAKASDLEVGLFDIRGRRVTTLARGPVPASAGVSELIWNVRTSGVASGVYFVRATAPSAAFRAERKVVVIQ